MKKKFALKSIAFVVVLVVFMSIGAGSLFAQEQAQEQNQESFMQGFGNSLHKGFGIISEMIEKMLGLSKEEIRSEIQEGKTLSEIAQENNVSTEEIEEAVISSRRERFALAVQNGCLTPEEAEERLTRMKEKFQQRMGNRSNGGNGFGFGCKR